MSCPGAGKTLNLYERVRSLPSDVIHRLTFTLHIPISLDRISRVAGDVRRSQNSNGGLLTSPRPRKVVLDRQATTNNLVWSLGISTSHQLRRSLREMSSYLLERSVASLVCKHRCFRQVGGFVRPLRTGRQSLPTEDYLATLGLFERL